MAMTFDEVKPDTRVICHSRGNVKGTVLRKIMGRTNNAEELVQILFDGGAIAWNRPDQLSPLDEPAPAPKLSRPFRGSSTFWMGGEEYAVYNTLGGNVKGFWACKRISYGDESNEDWIVMNAVTRTEAFKAALEKLRG